MNVAHIFSRVVRLLREVFKRLKLFPKAFRRRFGRTSRLGNLERRAFLVVSPGGAGTTMLLLHLAKFAPLQSPHDRDGLKHLPRVPSGTKVLFVYADTATAAMSLRRRGMLLSQAVKLGCLSCVFQKSTRLQVSIQRAMVGQIRRFLRAEEQEPARVMCVEYDQLWNELDRVADFLEIENPDFILNFPERRRRKSEPPGSDFGPPQ